MGEYDVKRIQSGLTVQQAKLRAVTSSFTASKTDEARSVQADEPDHMDTLLNNPKSVFMQIIPELKQIFDFVRDREAGNPLSKTTPEGRIRVGDDTQKVVTAWESGANPISSSMLEKTANDYRFDKLQLLFEIVSAFPSQRLTFRAIDVIAAAITLGNLEVPTKTFGGMSPVEFEKAIFWFTESAKDAFDKSDLDSVMCGVYGRLTNCKWTPDTTDEKGGKYVCPSVSPYAKGPSPPIFRNPSLLSDPKKRFKSASELKDASIDGFDPSSPNRIIFDGSSAVGLATFEETSDTVIDMLRLTVSWVKGKDALNTWAQAAKAEDYTRTLFIIKWWSKNTVDTALKTGKIPKPYGDALTSAELVKGFLMDFVAQFKNFTGQLNGSSIDDAKFAEWQTLAQSVYSKHNINSAAVQQAAQGMSDDEVKQMTRGQLDLLSQQANISKELTTSGEKSPQGGLNFPTWAIAVMAVGGLAVVGFGSVLLFRYHSRGKLV
jgi:hypothetical protein